MSDPPKLLDRVHAAIRTRHYSRRRRFILFHNKRHPSAMGAQEVNAFVSSLATGRNVSASTQGQALCALIFLYRHVLDDPLPWIDELVRARRPARLTVVLKVEETRMILDRPRGTPRLVAHLPVGSGLRLLEVLRLRVKDLDFGRSRARSGHLDGAGAPGSSIYTHVLGIEAKGVRSPLDSA